MDIYVKVDPRECFRHGVIPTGPGVYARLPPMPADLSIEDRATLAECIHSGDSLRGSGIAPYDAVLVGFGVPTWEAVREYLPKLREELSLLKKQRQEQVDRDRQRRAEEKKQRAALFEAVLSDRARLANCVFTEYLSTFDRPGQFSPGADQRYSFSEFAEYFSESGINSTEFWAALKADYKKVIALQNDWPRLWAIVHGSADSSAKQLG
jgi:hypothetical protein